MRQLFVYIVKTLYDGFRRWTFTTLTLIACVLTIMFVPQIHHVLLPPHVALDGTIALDLKSTFTDWHTYYLCFTALACALCVFWNSRSTPATGNDTHVMRQIRRVNQRLVVAPLGHSSKRRLITAAFCAIAIAFGILAKYLQNAAPLLFTLSLLTFVVTGWLLVREWSGINSRLWWRFGRLLLVATLLLVWGEVMWCLATYLSFSHSIYTIWVIPSLLALFFAIAQFLDEWQRTSDLPIRIASLGVVILVAHNLMPAPVGDASPSNVSVEVTAEGTRIDEQTNAWLCALERRLMNIPGDRPVLMVAASGGGSRAAMFTALVFEAMKRDPFELWRDGEPYNMADHVLMISSVSGGSLATAYYAEHGAGHDSEGDLINVSREDLNKEMRRASEKLETFNSEAFHATKVECEVLEKQGKTPSTAPWIFKSVFVDDMCTDFMAPLLRGVVHFGVERGQCVSEFWREDLEIGGKIESADDWQSDNPLLLFCATDVSDGVPLIVGQPALPQGFFRRLSSDGDTLVDPTSPIPAKCIGDVSPNARLKVVDAVRLSANFPWGFAIAALPEGKNGVPHVIDGGVFDNSGVSALRLVLDRLGALAYVQDHPTAKRIVDILQERGVGVVEIDSGAKPSGHSDVSRMFAELYEPVLSLENSSYAASISGKRDHFDAMVNALRYTQWTFGRINRKPTDTFEPTISVFRLPSIQCNQNERVMTAWALGPGDKAQVLVRFINEWKILKRNWGELLSAIAHHRRAAKSVNTNTNTSERESLNPRLFLITDKIRKLNAEFNGMNEERRRLEQQADDEEELSRKRNVWSAQLNEVRWDLECLAYEANKLANDANRAATPPLPPPPSSPSPESPSARSPGRRRSG